MGTVWYGEHVTIGRRAAIKVLHPQFAALPELTARFVDEARAASAINHPNIVEIHDFGQDAQQSWLVMELLEGETLGARLERQGMLDPADVVDIVEQVALALTAAHGRGIVHRDLKPENVFLASQDDYPDRIKVLDFGIAKLSGSPTEGATPVGVAVGTPTYMSPEQCVGDETLDHRTDIYALGVMMYEMLAGEPPFLGDTFGRLVVGHMTQLPPSLSKRNPGVAPEVAAVVERALEKKPADRFQNMAELAGAFRQAALPTPEERLSREQRRAQEAQQSADVANELLTIIERKLESGLVPLPAMPIAVVEALALLDQPNCDFSQVAARLQADPLVTTRVLGLVNSPAFGAREPIKELSAACRRLGMKPLRSLLVGLSARQAFRSRDARIREQFENIWSHCVATALLARRLADCVFGVDPSAAYLAGLLHDIGKPVVAVFLLEAEKHLLEELGASWLSPAVWGQTVEAAHQRVGLTVATHWGLPEEVREAIAGQREYEASRRYGNLVRYVDALATVEGFGADQETRETMETLLAGRELLKLDEASEAQLTDGLEHEVGALCALN